MSETQSQDNCADRGTVTNRSDEGSVALSNKQIVTVPDTVSVDELRAGDLVRNLVGNGSPVTVIGIHPASETPARRIVHVHGNDGLAVAVWLWKWSRVERACRMCSHSLHSEPCKFVYQSGHTCLCMNGVEIPPEDESVCDMCSHSPHYGQCKFVYEKGDECPCFAPSQERVGESNRYIEALQAIKAMIEDPANNPKNRNDMTTHRLNGLLAQIYAEACQAVSARERPLKRY